MVLRCCYHHCSLQAVEFWSTVCDTEIDLDEEDDDSMPNHKFIEAAAPQLVPVLLEQLTKQESDEPDSDESSWNMAMASGTCLGLMARACRDAIVPLVLPFVNANITRSAAAEDWHLREAATFAFGSIMDGPSPDSLKQWVQQGLVYLLQALGTVSRQQALLPVMMSPVFCMHADGHCVHGKVLLHDDGHHRLLMVLASYCSIYTKRHLTIAWHTSCHRTPATTCATPQHGP